MNVDRHSLRGLLPALICSLAVAAAGSTTASAQPRSGAPAEAERLVEAIRKHRATVWHWQRVMGKKRSRGSFAERRTSDLERLDTLRDFWKRRAHRIHGRAKRPPHEAAWLCIHRHEGSWKDPHAPYYGGLQMSRQFQRAFGRYLLRRKGTADRWTPVEQMWTAEQAHRAGLGFYPWPNTARACGLL
jgi:hypothetical protein